MDIGYTTVGQNAITVSKSCHMDGQYIIKNITHRSYKQDHIGASKTKYWS